MDHSVFAAVVLVLILASAAPGIKNGYARWISFLFSNKTGTTAAAASREILPGTDDIQGRIFALRAVSPWQEKLHDHPMEHWDDIFAGRWLALEHRRGSIPTALIAVLVGWLSVIFGIFGLSAPRNWSMCVVFCFARYRLRTPSSALSISTRRSGAWSTCRRRR
jgi:hypothetical protein